MKRIVALLLAMVLLLTGCEQQVVTSTTEEKSTAVSTDTVVSKLQPDNTTVEDATEDISEEPVYQFHNVVPEFGSMDDPNLLRYVEDNLYSELVSDLNSQEYFVENVSAIYLSEEYLEELEYNSKKNIYFGYTLDELDAAFEGTRYVFTLGENNETVVQPFEAYDDTYQKVIKNVAIGSGVIIICVTVSVVTAGAGAPAVSIIFATAAKTGSIMALSSGALSGVATAVITGVQTNDMNQALKAGLLTGSESFKWGAITGAVAGSATAGLKYAKAMEALKGVALNGLTTQEAAAIQMESSLPIDIIKQFHSLEEYKVYKNCGLVSKMIKGELALAQNIDLSIKSALPDGTIVTNLERMALGYAPVDSFGAAYQLHHIGQKADATLAILTEAQHRDYSDILHVVKKSEIDRKAFDAVREAFWKAYAAAYM